MAVTKSTDPIDILLEMGIDLDNLSEEEDYLSALKEAIAKIQFQTKGAGDERQRILQEEVIKVRKSRKAADPKFKAKKTTVSPDAFFGKKKPEENPESTPGQEALPGKGPAAIVKRQTIKPELFKKPEEPEEQKDNKDIKVKENNILEDILKTLNSILGTLKKQNKLSAKQAEKDRKAKEKKKRGAQEEKLESPIKKFLGAANKIVKPVKSFLDGLLEFFVKVFIGRLLVKLIKWGSENGDKVDAILGFFEKTWPALLAVGLLFFTGLGGFIGNLISLVAGFIPRLLGLVPKVLKGAMGLIKFVATNPFAAGAVLFGAGAFIPKLFPDTVDAEEKQTKEAPGTNEEKIKALEEQKANLNPLERLQGVDAEIDEQIEFLKTGETKKYNKGGIVPGSGNTDSVRAMLTPGEFVMSKGAVQQYGLDTMKSMNAAGGGTNIPMVSNGITYAAGGGEVKNPDAELKQNDEPKDRPKGDHSHNSSDILGLNKIGGMISGFAKTPIGNALLPGVGPALSIAETLMGRGKPKARKASAGFKDKNYGPAAMGYNKPEMLQSEVGQLLIQKGILDEDGNMYVKNSTLLDMQIRRAKSEIARSKIPTTTETLPDGTIRTQGEGQLVAGEVYDPNNPTEMQQAALALGGQMGNPAPVTATPKTPAAPAPTITEQPKEKGRGLLSMYAGYLDFMTGNVFDIDGMGKPSSMSASPEKEAPEEEGEKSGGGGSLKGLTGQDFRDLAYIVSGEAQRGTDDEYGVAAAVLNRVADPAWPNTIREVGSQSGQFEAVYTGKAYDDPALAQKLASPEGQAKIVEALKMLKGRTDFKGTSQYGNMGQGDVKFSDRGNFYHYKEQVGKTDPPPSPIPTYYQKFIGTGGPAVTLSGTKSSASGITASPGSGGSSGGSSKTSGTSGPGGSKGRLQAPAGPGSVGSKTSYGDYLKNLYGKKKSASGITPLPSSTMSKGKSAGGPSADAGKNPGNQMTSPDNNIPAINAEAMHSDEKIEVLGIEIS